MAARTEEAARAFLRHRMLQLRSRELAEGAIRSVSFGQDERIAIDFGADAPNEVESIMREARNLNLERSPPPIGAAFLPPKSWVPSISKSFAASSATATTCSARGFAYRVHTGR